MVEHVPYPNSIRATWHSQGSNPRNIGVIEIGVQIPRYLVLVPFMLNISKRSVRIQGRRLIKVGAEPTTLRERPLAGRPTGRIRSTADIRTSKATTYERTLERKPIKG